MRQIHPIEIKTPPGPMIAGTPDDVVCLLEFFNRIRFEKELADFQKILDAEIVKARNKHSDQIDKEIEEYFESSRKTFEIPVHIPGNAFSRSGWNMWMNIPYGEPGHIKNIRKC